MNGEVHPLAIGSIQKIDEEKQFVFGWAYVAKKADGEQVTDHSGDQVTDLTGLEDAVYDYVLTSREGDEMHVGPVTSRMIESIVFTPDKLMKMGLPEGSVPIGWWTGFHVEDPETWDKVKKGELRMFSIAGTGTREPM